MAVPRVNECCCGCTLKTGAMIIGILECIMAAIALIVCSLTAEGMREISQAVDINVDGTEIPVAVINALFGSCVTLAVFSAIELLFVILLLVGVCQDRPSFLKPWIIYSIVSLVLTLIVGIINVYAYVAMGQAGSGIGYIIIALLFIALRIYYIIVVNSLKVELEEGTTGHQPNFERNRKP